MLKSTRVYEPSNVLLSINLENKSNIKHYNINVFKVINVVSNFLTDYM
jgi:hypothetical protein